MLWTNKRIVNGFDGAGAAGCIILYYRKPVTD